MYPRHVSLFSNNIGSNKYIDIKYFKIIVILSYRIRGYICLTVDRIVRIQKDCSRLYISASSICNNYVKMHGW